MIKYTARVIYRKVGSDVKLSVEVSPTEGTGLGDGRCLIVAENWFRARDVLGALLRSIATVAADFYDEAVFIEVFHEGEGEVIFGEW
jgi:hypothetical protein